MPNKWRDVNGLVSPTRTYSNIYDVATMNLCNKVARVIWESNDIRSQIQTSLVSRFVLILD
jgi:hypothetical protein